MFNQLRRKTVLYMTVAYIIFAVIPSVGWAAPGTVLNKVRTSQTADKVRIVFDVATLPEYTVTTLENPMRLVIDMPGAVNKATDQIIFNDPTLDKLRMSTEDGSVKTVIDFKTAYTYKVFTLKNPNRLVVDILKRFDRKYVDEITPGITYTAWMRSAANGPVQAYILDIDPKSGYVVKPAISNGVVQGLEPVKVMADNNQALAAVNGSYFGLDGSIIGLLKINGEIASTPELPRTALGIMPEGQVLIDQVEYQGKVELPDGQNIPINAVNRERGENELILYNDFYGTTTGCNGYGQEYVIINDKVVALNQGNTQIPSGAIVLSAHGSAAQKLSALKVGDTVKVHETLGPMWDKTTHAIGAGPMLVKNNSVFLTTKIEEFGSDVAGGRAPRTALGVKGDGHILAVVVDGRQEHSIGMTLLELAVFMQELGAEDAMNFDGGGSSEMVVKGKIVNKPSDGRERRVGDALVIVPSMLPITKNTL